MTRPSRSLRTTFQLLWWEGAFAAAYETWVGPTYLGGLAGELGVSVGFLSFITALPWIGSLGQIVGYFAFARATSVRRYTLWLAGFARAVWSIPLFAAIFLGWRAKQAGLPFPKESWFLLTGGVALLSALSGSSSAVSWLSWMRGLVPGRFQGRFFGTRQRGVMGTLIGANLLGALLVDWKWEGVRVGSISLCLLALSAATLSTILLARVRDLPLRSPERVRPSLDLLLEPYRDPVFARVLLFGACFNAAVQIAGPYFSYYFTRDLQIPMGTVAFWAMITNVGAFAASVAWGRTVDRSERIVRVFSMAGVLIGLSPLPYAFLGAEGVRAVAPVEFLINGVAWAGYNVAVTTLLFRFAPPGRSALYFTVYHATLGILGAVFSALGGWLSVALAPLGGFRALWVLASVLRLVVLAIGARVISRTLKAHGR
jgi:hypothetical protein